MRKPDRKISRRKFLKSAGAGIAALGAGIYAGENFARAVRKGLDMERHQGSKTPTGMATGNCEPDKTIEVPAGETETIYVDDDNPLENTLIDISKPKADVAIRAGGSNWRIKNVGIKGYFDKTEPGAKFAPYVEEGGQGIVDNLYMPGTNMTTPNRIKNVWVRANKHKGILTFKNCFFKNGADNQVYASGPAAQQDVDAGGPVRFENCHSENAGVSHFRVGQNDSWIRNCTVKCDEAVPPVPSPPFGKERNPRGIWIPEGAEVPVENCDILMDAPHSMREAVLASGTSVIHLRDSRVKGRISSWDHTSATVNQENVTGNPDPTPNPGVPTTPGEAACGTSSNTSNDTGSTCIEGEDYDLIKVEEGGDYTPSLDNGETLENKIIDITAEGANVRIDARADNWTIRNVAVKGKLDVDEGLIIVPGGKNGLVENVYLGDGAIPGRAKGVWIDHGKTEGPITFKNVHVSGFPNNGIYGSPTVDSLNGGIIHVRDSYFDSNNISQFKIGSPNGTCEVTNTVIRTDNDTPHNGFNQHNKRGIWALDGETTVKNCDIKGSIDVEPGATLDVQNTRWEGSANNEGTLNGSPSGTPDLTPPEGVPMKPKEAVCETSSTNTEININQPGPHTMELEGDDNMPKNYIIKIDGEITSTDGEQLGDNAVGTIENGKHAIEYDGTVNEIRAAKGLELIYDGERLNKAQIAAMCNGVGISNGYSSGSDPSTSEGWSYLSDMPEGMTSQASAVIDGKLYSFGGSVSGSGSEETTDKIYAYDPSSDSWSQEGTLPRSMNAAAATSVGDRAYIFGGSEIDAPWGSGDLIDGVYRFTPGEGTSQVGTHPGGNFGATALYNEQTGLIYHTGGATGSTSDEDKVFVFDPETEEVIDSNFAQIPDGVRWPSGATTTVNGTPYMYVAGGISYTGGGHAAKFNVRINLENGNTEEMASLPTAAGKLPRGNLVVGNKIYVPLGLLWPEGTELQDDNFKEATWSYDLVNDSWNTDLPPIKSNRARDNGATGVINGKIYLAGGHTKEYEGDGSHIRTKYTEEFSPP